MDLKNKKTLWIYRILFVIAGGIAGYIYWLKVGCSSGTCPITSQWHNTTLYGGVMGYLVGDLVKDMLNKSKSKSNEQLSESDK